MRGGRRNLLNYPLDVGNDCRRLQYRLFPLPYDGLHLPDQVCAFDLLPPHSSLILIFRRGAEVVKVLIDLFVPRLLVVIARGILLLLVVMVVSYRFRCYMGSADTSGG